MYHEEAATRPKQQRLNDNFVGLLEKSVMANSLSPVCYLSSSSSMPFTDGRAVVVSKPAQNRYCANSAILTQNRYDIVVLLDCPPESAKVGGHGVRMNRMCHMPSTQENPKSLKLQVGRFHFPFSCRM
jgi:hypothetical protein